MIIMPSNCTGFEAGRLFGMFPDKLAHLHSVDGKREPKANAKWALDNGVFGAWQSGREWSEEPFYRYLDDYSAWKPMWAVVPDWVGDKKLTLQRWEEHAPAVQAFGVPLALAVQDGMTLDDLPKNPGPDIIFIGGTTSWKWKNLMHWMEFPRVHVGRVNSYRLLETAEKAGAESCDGTGWFRDPKRTKILESYLSRGPEMQLNLI